MASRRLVFGLAVVLFAIVALASGISGTKAAGEKSKEITFTKDVAPIFYKNCVVCHRENDLAPMSLMSYKEARPWARSIREKVLNRQMPPWYADPSHGQFSNERRLSQEEVDTIVGWIDQGSKEGLAKDLPPAPKFVEGWHIGKPDVVLSMTDEHTVEAQGPDDYLYFTIPTNFKEDRWIQAAEIKPGNKTVVHHVIAFIQTPEMIAAAKYYERRRPENLNSIFYKDGTLSRVRIDAPVIDHGCGDANGGSAFGKRDAAAFTGTLLAGYAPGKDWDVWPVGVAKKVPAGSNIVFQMHYSKATGKVEKDRSSIGLIFAKEPPKKMVVTLPVANHFFKIPPGADNHEVTACYEFDKDVHLINYMPHMHVRGKDMKYEAIFPDGRRETLLSVPKWSFSWQQVYWLKEPISVARGTKLIVTAHFDNSEKNKYNPDPRKSVRFGDPTYDEMMIGWLDYVIDKPRDRVVAKLSSAVLDKYAGQYSVAPGVVVTVTREGDKLLGQLTGQPPMQLYPESETKFFLKLVEGEITFLTNQQGEAVEVVFVINGQTIKAKKVKAVASK